MVYSDAVCCGGAGWCSMVQDGTGNSARLCMVAQNGAEWCRMAQHGQDGLGFGHIVQDGAELCRLVRHDLG